MRGCLAWRKSWGDRGGAGKGRGLELELVTYTVMSLESVVSRGDSQE